jgi:hypothetical protein
MHSRKVGLIAFVALFLLILSFDAFGQKVRLRSKITPNCGSSSTWKFADIYAEGNIAVMGSYNCRGAFIFDISNPDAPVLASWYNPGASQQFLEAIIVNGRGYFGSGNGGGVHIVDLTNPYNPQLLGIVNSSNGGGFNSIHEMMVYQQGGATYLIENFNGFSSKLLKFINVTVPSAPVFVRDLNPTETTWVHAMHIRGNRMITSGWGSSSQRGRTEIYDISNIATQAPVLLGFIEDPSASLTNGNNMHSSWTSEDGRYLYSAREVTNSNGPSPGDVRVYDISNPATPLLVNRMSMSDLSLNAVTPHNPVVMGNKLYISWYQAGLQVFDISNPATPQRIGQYDTFESTFRPPDPEKLSVIDDPWDMVCGSPNLQNLLPTNYDGAWAVFPFLGEDKVLVGDLNSGLIVLDVRGAGGASKNLVSDFDGDRKTDLAVFRPAFGDWEFISSQNGSLNAAHWGTNGDKIVPGDYDGDGRTDFAVWRPSTGVWWINQSSGGAVVAQFGTNGDIPVPGDYDADGRTDIAVWRPSNGVWYIARSTLGLSIFQWGINGDKPFSGDFDGDGKADAVIWRPSNGVWYVIQSSSSIPVIAQWGLNGDKPVFGDFTGDGKSDFGIYRPSNGYWYILNNNGTLHSILKFGISEDNPVPGDYDGDGKTDIAVFRPGSNLWYVIFSSDSSLGVWQYGLNGDTPAPAAVNPE